MLSQPRQSTLYHQQNLLQGDFLLLVQGASWHLIKCQKQKMNLIKKGKKSKLRKKISCVDWTKIYKTSRNSIEIIPNLNVLLSKSSNLNHNVFHFYFFGQVTLDKYGAMPPDVSAIWRLWFCNTLSLHYQFSGYPNFRIMVENVQSLWQKPAGGSSRATAHQSFPPWQLYMGCCSRAR